MADAKQFSLGELAQLLGFELRGDGQCLIRGIASLASASEGDIAFLSSASYRNLLADTQASAVIMTEEDAAVSDVNALITDNPYLGFARATQVFDNSPSIPQGVHPTAVVSASAQIGEDVSVGAHVVIGDFVQLKEGAAVAAHCFVGDSSIVGAGSIINANVTIHHNVVIGEQVIIHSGTVIGADGFGFAFDGSQWHKIAQLGGVLIGDQVEIGASTSIDRGALDDTVIEDGVKIDNQVMVAHNVHIGAHTAIAGCVGISGSTRIGKHCTIAGGVGFVGHINVADRVHVTGMTMVTKNIDEPGSYSSGTAMMPTGLWKKNSVRMRHLDELAKRIRELEKQVENLKGQGN